MSSEEIKKNRIMDLAFKRFTTVGISQVTMDDIARGVGMGKGTLYKFFPSKEILLSNTIEFFATRIEKSIEEVLADEKLTPMDKLNLFLKTVVEKLSKINPATIAYLERSLPEVYDKIEKTRERIIMKNLIRLFEDGKKTGLFNPQMDELLVAHMLIGAISHIIENKVLSTLSYSFDCLFTSIISTLLHGCLSEEGRKYRTQEIPPQYQAN
jgi:AcrR family transcriptional regulator